MPPVANPLITILKRIARHGFVYCQASAISFVAVLPGLCPTTSAGESGTQSGWSDPKPPSGAPAPAPLVNTWNAAAATAVIFNSALPESVALARFYAQKRGIPESHLIGITCKASETITRAEYYSTIRNPILDALVIRKLVKFTRTEPRGTRSMTERSIRILAPVYGVPVRIDRTKGDDGKRRDAPAGKGDEASVDAELTLLGTSAVNPDGPLKNPYFQSDAPFPTLEFPPMFLVARLDGPSPEVVQRMIRDSIAAEESGLEGFAYFDLAQKGANYEAGDQWISDSEKLLHSHGFPTIVDTHKECFPSFYPMGDAAIYFGWYSANPNGPFLNPQFNFAPGAIACHLHSFSAEQLRQSKRHWTGPLLRRGAAASLGNVWEPYLTFTVHFDILTDRLLKGYTFAEATWMATPALSWMNIAVGDPLYRPFGSRLIGPQVGEKPADESDFAVYRKLATDSTFESQADRKRALVDAAAKRKSGSLLESAGLLSASDSRHAEAIELFEHASETYDSVPDKIRNQLHIAELHRRSDDITTAKSTLEAILSSFPDAIEARAAKEVLNRLNEKSRERSQATPPSPLP